MPASPLPPDAAEIRRLVEEVLRRIAAGEPTPAETRPTARPDGTSAGRAVHVGDAVITLAHVERLPPGTRQVAVPARAVVTPSARDRARELGVTITRAAATPAGPVQAAAGPPFVIAQAAADAVIAARAAAIARAVPRSERLPATGLVDVLAALAVHASRDAARSVLLTPRPQLALVAANRSPSLRAVTGGDAATLGAAASDCAANLLVVDPARFRGSLEQFCVGFASRPGGPLPPELAQSPPGCTCQGHPR